MGCLDPLGALLRSCLVVVVVVVVVVEVVVVVVVVVVVAQGILLMRLSVESLVEFSETSP